MKTVLILSAAFAALAAGAPVTQEDAAASTASPLPIWAVPKRCPPFPVSPCDYCEDIAEDWFKLECFMYCIDPSYWPKECNIDNRSHPYNPINNNCGAAAVVKTANVPGTNTTLEPAKDSTKASASSALLDEVCPNCSGLYGTEQMTCIFQCFRKAEDIVANSARNISGPIIKSTLAPRDDTTPLFPRPLGIRVNTLVAMMQDLGQTHNHIIMMMLPAKPDYLPEHSVAFIDSYITSWLSIYDVHGPLGMSDETTHKMHDLIENAIRKRSEGSALWAKRFRNIVAKRFTDEMNEMIEIENADQETSQLVKKEIKEWWEELFARDADRHADDDIDFEADDYDEGK